MDNRFKATGLAVALAAAFTFSQASIGHAADHLKGLDPDHDGTVDMMEAKSAASAVFDRLERDHDGTLDARELRRRMSAKELAAADPDHDGTLTKDEYLAVVEMHFKAADRDHDGTLDAKELRSRHGRELMRLLK